MLVYETLSGTWFVVNEEDFMERLDKLNKKLITNMEISGLDYYQYLLTGLDENIDLLDIDGEEKELIECYYFLKNIYFRYPINVLREYIENDREFPPVIIGDFKMLKGNPIMVITNMCERYYSDKS